jgi:hypothetical protein
MEVHSSPPKDTPRAEGRVSYYPARFRASFPDALAALASLGVRGERAALYLANADIERSEAVALPIAGGPPGAEALALIVRGPGGRADVWTGIPAQARATRREAEAVAADFALAIPGCWHVMQWVQQPGAVQ